MMIHRITAREVCVIGCLHAGRGGGNTMVAAQVVTKLLPHMTLVLLGDTGPDSHLWKLFGKAAWAWEDGDIYFWWAVLEFLARGGKVIWVPGNHDEDLGQTYMGLLQMAPGFDDLCAMFPASLNLSDKDGKGTDWKQVLGTIFVAPALEVTVGGVRYLFHHGHRWDFVLDGLLSRIETLRAKLGLLRTVQALKPLNGWERLLRRVKLLKVTGPEFYRKDMSHYGAFLFLWTGQAMLYSWWGWLRKVKVVVVGHWHAPKLYRTWFMPRDVICATCYTNGWAAHMMIDERGDYELIGFTRQGD